MDEEKIKLLLDKLQKDFDKVVDNFDKGMDIIHNQPNPEVGITPKETVYTERRVKLHHYKPKGEIVYKKPLLIINSLINGYYILDLLQDFSIVSFLLDEGFDIYSIEWGNPKDNEKDVSFDYHVTGYVKNCVDTVKEISGEDSINILGYCMGGNLGMVYAAYFPEDVNAYINLAAPTDFSKGGVLRKWVDKEVINVDKLIDSFGNVPTYIMDMAFPWIKPSERMKAMSYLLQNPQNTFYSRVYKAIMQWRDDNMPFPGSFAKTYLKDLYRENKIFNDTFTINDKPVSLKNIKCPVLNIVAKSDYITPPESTEPFTDLVSSEDKDTLYIKGGHLDIILNVTIRHEVWPKLKEWLANHSN